jgi:hypothetical protein
MQLHLSAAERTNNGTMIVISATSVAASHARISSLAVAMKVPGTNVQDLHLTSPACHRTICAFSNMVQRLDSVSL